MTISATGASPQRRCSGLSGCLLLFSKATTVEPWWAHPWIGQADAIGPGLASFTWIRADGTASNFCPRTGFSKLERRHGDPSRSTERTGGSAVANQGPDLPTDSFSAEGYQGQLLLVAPSQRAVRCVWDRHPKSQVLMPMLSGLMFSQPFDEANGKTQLLSPPLGTKAWDAATRRPVMSRAGRITVGPP